MNKIIPILAALIISVGGYTVYNNINAPISQHPEGTMLVHFLDVGQADSILVQTGGQNMLIDAGNNADGGTVVDYLTRVGVTRLDALIGTHPHEDHIGGMDNVINAFDIGELYMPRATSTTKTFEDVVRAAQNKGLSATAPTPGEGLVLGEAAGLFLAPISASYKDLNNYSIVLRLQHGENSFLFTGDAEDVSEEEMLTHFGARLKSNVLKIGHHGSSSSTGLDFLQTVNPTAAVIMCGKGNSYGHPTAQTLERLQGITLYRTDEHGTIVALSDGRNIQWGTER